MTFRGDYFIYLYGWVIYFRVWLSLIYDRAADSCNFPFGINEVLSIYPSISYTHWSRYVYNYLKITQWGVVMTP